MDISKTKLRADHRSTLTGMNDLAFTLGKPLGRHADLLALIGSCVLAKTICPRTKSLRHVRYYGGNG
ncbi:hypothetical protein GGI43DRAFT_419557 [Trichoderma evansii]